MFGRKSYSWDRENDVVTVWIRRATRGLCDEARERVEKEIRGHYADALQEVLDRGEAQSEAERSALVALGSSRKARRGFLKTNLTKRQSWLLNEVITWKGWKRRIYLYFLYLVILGMIGSEHLGQLHQEPQFVFFGYASLLFLGMILLSWACQVLVERKYLRTAIAVTWIGFLIAVVLPLVIGYLLGAELAHSGLAWLVVIGVLSTGIDHIPLFAKLCRTPQEV
ncbi:MAG TPA: hypothetical protein PLI09_24960 [Candidatus Hydrogenedentes bacterium]|mgnify:CR=1 FL=1|nr:hypothetical protein [Candidatus Hydrogenedentota bacterium]